MTNTPTVGLKLIVQDLDPGYFAMVMATGIISVASWLLGLSALAQGLLFVNVVAFLTLTTLTIERLFWYRTRALADLGDHLRGTGFLTTGAASCILGNQFVIIAQLPQVALLLWILDVVLWLVLFYTFIALRWCDQRSLRFKTGSTAAG